MSLANARSFAVLLSRRFRARDGGSGVTGLPERRERRRQQPAVSERARDVFLEGLRGGFSVTHAAKAAGVYRRRFYELRAADEVFADSWADAFESGTDLLRDELRRRAVDGWEEPVVSAGKILGTVQKFSDRLLELELKRRDLGYRERSGVTVAVGVGQPPDLQHGVPLSDVAKVLLDAGVDLQALAAGPEIVDGDLLDERDEPTAGDG